MKQRTLIVATAVLCLAFIAGGAQAQITNPSFDVFPSLTGWTSGGGTTSIFPIVNGGLPTDGFFYAVLNTAGTGPATAHSNEGGAGTDASGTSSLSQNFTLADGSMTTLTFDCNLSSLVNSSGDFLEASLSDGTSTINFAHLDQSDLVGGLSGLNTFSIDIGAEFPSATTATVFTLTFHVGDGNGASVADGRFDFVRFGPGTVLAENSLAFVNNGVQSVITINTIDPMTRYYSLFSLNTTGPLGGGPLAGLYIDQLVFDILGTPFGGSPFHNFTNGSGQTLFPIPNFVFPTGLQIDSVLAVFDAAAQVVVEITPATRYVWP